MDSEVKMIEVVYTDDCDQIFHMESQERMRSTNEKTKIMIKKVKRELMCKAEN